MISLEKTHATKREATAMMVSIVERINETDWMRETLNRFGLDALEMYHVIKVGRRWHIKATQAHLAAAKALRPKGYGV